jgi:hypothetical protein
MIRNLLSWGRETDFQEEGAVYTKEWRHELVAS